MESVDTSQWVATMPKVELHLHLEGSMSVATVAELAKRHDVDPTPVWPRGLPERFSFSGFPDFANQFIFGLSLLRTGEDLATITENLAETLASQNVRYAEVTTTAFTHFMDRDDRPGMSASDYRDGLNQGRQPCRRPGRGHRLGHRHPARSSSPPTAQSPSTTSRAAKVPDGLVAIGLGGYEVGFPAQGFVEQFARARALGLQSVPHAGETEGADSVRSAVLDLGADRIGHGVRCLEDQSLVAELVDRGIMLEVCPTSNDLLQVIETIDDHALPALMAAGLRVCINSDDPGWFGTDLTTELIIASERLGVTPEEHVALQLDAVAASFASNRVKTAITSELEAFTADT